MAMRTLDYTAPVGAAWAADPIFRSEFTSAIQADNKAAGHVANAVARLDALDVPFTALASDDWTGGPIESAKDDAAFTAALLIAVDGEAMKTGRKADTAPVSKADAETLRYVIEECSRKPEPEDKEVWQQHSAALYSRVAWLRNKLWSIQDPVTWALFSKGTGACTSKKRRAEILNAPENSERVAKFAKAEGAQGGPGSKGGVVNNKRTVTKTAITKDSDVIEILKLFQQFHGDKCPESFGPNGIADDLIEKYREESKK